MRRSTIVAVSVCVALAACSGTADTGAQAPVIDAEDPAELVDGPAETDEQTDPDSGEDLDDPVEPEWPHAGEELVIGRISALEGPFATAAQDAELTVQMAIDEFGGEVAGRPIRTILERSDTTPELAVELARKLVEEDGVHVIHGPLSGGEGEAIADYAHSVPHVTFVDGASAGRATTLANPAPNYFRWHSEAAMWTSPLGTYVVEELGYTNIVILAEDYAFPHTQVGAFLESYCAAGGTLAEIRWIPLGTIGIDRLVIDLPDDMDALLVAFGGADALDFISLMVESGLQVPLVGGSIMVTGDVLDVVEDQARQRVLGTVASGPLPPPDADLPEWQDFLGRYRQLDGAGENPTVQAVLFYNSMRALLTGVEAAGGVVESDGGASLRAAMREMTLDSPIGPLTLNDNNQASANVFIYDVREDADGGLKTHLLDVAEGVEQGTELWERLDAHPGGALTYRPVDQGTEWWERLHGCP